MNRELDPSGRQASAHNMSRIGPLMLLLWGLMLSATGVFSLRPNSDAARSMAQRLVDPNTASWAELTVLPRIGETMAKRIVRYRQAFTASEHDNARVFSKPDDLAGVRGIGSVTVVRMKPFLRF